MRNEQDYIPDIQETYNFRFFKYIKKGEIQQESDIEIINDVKRFFGGLVLNLSDPDDVVILMRWNPGFDCWTASKFNKHLAKDFLNSY